MRCAGLQEALNRQSRPSADELGLSMDPFTDSMSDLDTLDLRLEYVAAMMKGVSLLTTHRAVPEPARRCGTLGSPSCRAYSQTLSMLAAALHELLAVLCSPS